ncbi:unnamed protein product [Sphagnum tenellum]
MELLFTQFALEQQIIVFQGFVLRCTSESGVTESISIANLGFLPVIFITVLKGKIGVGSHNASWRGLVPELLIRSEFHIQFRCAHDVDMGTDEDRLVVNVDTAPNRKKNPPNVEVLTV